jgi:uncharacterized protein YndB with AHSA1/START domain
MTVHPAMTLAPRGGHEIVVTRAFDAPREMIWDADTKPELVKRWMTGPDGWTMPVCDIDLRVGGAYRYRWRNGEGHEFGAAGEHREIVPNERIVMTQVMEGFQEEALMTLELAGSGGCTTATSTMWFPSAQARDGAFKTGMAKGMEMGFARLDEIFARETAQ